MDVAAVVQARDDSEDLVVLKELGRSSSTSVPATVTTASLMPYHSYVPTYGARKLDAAGEW
ncbi:hypothetical protein JCM10295v2_000355 [Rhodotorula toruloides]